MRNPVRPMRAPAASSPTRTGNSGRLPAASAGPKRAAVIRIASWPNMATWEVARGSISREGRHRFLAYAVDDRPQAAMLPMSVELAVGAGSLAKDCVDVLDRLAVPGRPRHRR